MSLTDTVAPASVNAPASFILETPGERGETTSKPQSKPEPKPKSAYEVFKSTYEDAVMHECKEAAAYFKRKPRKVDGVIQPLPVMIAKKALQPPIRAAHVTKAFQYEVFESKTCSNTKMLQKLLNDTCLDGEIGITARVDGETRTNANCGGEKLENVFLPVILFYPN